MQVKFHLRWALLLHLISMAYISTMTLRLAVQMVSRKNSEAIGIQRHMKFVLIGVFAENSRARLPYHPRYNLHIMDFAQDAPSPTASR